MTGALHLLVPGSLHRRTGGSLFDSRITAGLRALGHTVTVHELAGRFPDTDDTATDALTGALAAVPDGARAIIDGLALGDSPALAERHAARVRVVALVHHPLADETGLTPALRERFLAREARALAACERIVVTSPFTAARVERLGIAAGRIHVVEPGTDPAPAATGPDPGQPPRLLCVASLTPRKGQDLLVAALARQRHRAWSCQLVGDTAADPAFAEAVHEAIRAHGLEERIRLLGDCDPAALDRAYREASLFVLPSHYEGYGMALAEALARGLPVISTTGGAIPDTVPAAAGRLVPPGDTAALADALGEWLHVPGLRDAAARAAREHAAALPDWNGAAARFAAALEAAP